MSEPYIWSSRPEDEHGEIRTNWFQVNADFYNDVE
jgi:hypothetical protein